MMRSMFTAISGLKTHQVMLDITANNLANVNTIGYKGARMTFQDQLSQTQRSGAAANGNFGGANAAQVGLGVGVGAINNLVGSGSAQVTGGALDVMLQGDGWLRVGVGVPVAPGAPTNAELTYTRAGDLTRNDQGYLITRDGLYVMGKVAPDDGTGGAADNYIQIPNGATDIAIGPDGAVSFTPPLGYVQPGALPPIGGDGRAIAGYLSVAKFSNEAGLERVSNNRWLATPQSGGEMAGTAGGNFAQTIGGVLEMSNVDMATEFTSMISAQRGFQANSRVISTTDQMLQDLVNLVR